MRHLDKLLGAFLLLSFYIVDAKIEVFDRYGHLVDTFDDMKNYLTNYYPPTEGFIEAATPFNACKDIEPPSFLTNFTLGRFVLINGTDECDMATRVHKADEAGFDVAVVFDANVTPVPFIFSTKTYYLKIQLVLISLDDAIVIINSYLYNHSSDKNFVLRISSDLPDITYYMYLFGGVISVCFFVMLIFMGCLLVKCIQERRKTRRNRLSRRQIRQLATAKFSKGDEYDVCAICLETYNEGDKLRILPCSHAYHAKCIDPWLMNNRRNCPLCKRKIRFGDSCDESDSEDSELTSPAENTPLLSSPSAQSNTWGTFAATNQNQNDGGGPSSFPGAHVNYGTASLPDTFINPFLPSDDTENLIPSPDFSVNSVGHSPAGSSPSEQEVTVVVNFAEEASLDEHQKLIV